jgi:hypothetical protein
MSNENSTPIAPVLGAPLPLGEDLTSFSAPFLQAQSDTASASNCQGYCALQIAGVIAERFRTKLCSKWVENGGWCPYESRCMFAHGERELRTTEMNLKEGLTSEEAIRRFKAQLKAQARRRAAKRQRNRRNRARNALLAAMALNGGVEIPLMDSAEEGEELEDPNDMNDDSDEENGMVHELSTEPDCNYLTVERLSESRISTPNSSQGQSQSTQARSRSISPFLRERNDVEGAVQSRSTATFRHNPYQAIVIDPQFSAYRADQLYSSVATKPTPQRQLIPIAPRFVRVQ